MRKAVIREIDGFVQNVIELEEGTTWQPPAGHYIIDAGDGSPGDTWDGTKFIKPVITPPEPLVFNPPTGTTTERLDYIEEFLKKLYPPPPA